MILRLLMLALWQLSPNSSMNGSWSPPGQNFLALGRAPELFAEKVEAMSNGRMKIRVYGDGELVPALEVFNAVMQARQKLVMELLTIGKARYRKPSSLRCCRLE